MIGKTISHYKILEKLGSGSMGTVYKAEDTKLKRIVALKFLPPHLVSGEIEKKRFLHEAQAASALNHPNIITIYDIHDELDKVFIVMEYCEGMMLADKLIDGPLKQRELLDIGIGIADGLNTAHKADITHRDIKSQNIIVSDNCPPKIIDFGIAKQVGMTEITKDGTTLGTQCYMSPEQLHGSKIDQRSDIFSYGVVLYEMATGKLPFSGAHDAAILYSVVNEDPIPITTLNPNMDDELQRIVDKALKKNVKDRYQHVDEMLADLRNLKKKKKPPKNIKDRTWWRVPTYVMGALIIAVLVYMVFLRNDNSTFERNLGKKSIAVLPFTTIDRTEESEIFGDGIHDDILTQIAKIHDLKVIARTSVMHYRDTQKGIKEIANELNVTSILEGSVRRSGNAIRIVAQLIDPETEEHIWADTYDREYADIFAIQSDVAQKIAVALEATLTSKEIDDIDKIPTRNLEAYEYYIQGQIIGNSNLGIKDIESTIIPLYEKAVELDPNYVDAYVALSKSLLVLGWESYQNVSEELLNKAKIAMDMALELDSKNPNVLFLEGYYYYYGSRNYKMALDRYSLALQSRPNDSNILVAISYIKRRQGEYDESLKIGLEAIELDPLNNITLSETGKTAYWMRKWHLAEKLINRAILINPKHYDGYDFLVRIAINHKGDLDEARGILEKAFVHIDASRLAIKRAHIEYLSRDFSSALEISNEYQKNVSIAEIEDYENLLNKAIYAALLGNSELASSYFEILIKLCNDRLKGNPQDIESHQWLARAYAHLGIKEKTLNEVIIVENLLPKDELKSRIWRNHRALIYISTGMFDKAMDDIEYLLSRPSNLSVNQIKLDPLYDPIRDHPRFQEVLKKYGG